MREDVLKTPQAWKEADEKQLTILEKSVYDVSEVKYAFHDFLRPQN